MRVKKKIVNAAWRCSGLACVLLYKIADLQLEQTAIHVDTIIIFTGMRSFLDAVRYLLHGTLEIARLNSFTRTITLVCSK